MCGIIGLVTNREQTNRSDFQAALLSIAHRGPDASRVWISKNQNVGLGHVRLSILDLSDGAVQPMKSFCGNYILTFNGEIYNYAEIKAKLSAKGYTFNSSSDTEVLLNSFIEWGPNCLKYLRGMFSFVIFDQGAEELFIARDRAGEKPLYYAEANGKFVFASELKALLILSKIRATADRGAFGKLLSQGYTDNEQSILKGVKKLPAGSFLTVNTKNLIHRVRKYWELPEHIHVTESDEQFTADLEQLLTESVKLQLHADVPVGVLLSGGLDSSIITALAARNQRKINTFTVVFPGYKKEDESSYAKIVAEHFGTCHHELELPRADPSIIGELVKYFDEPMVDSSMIPTFLLSAEIAKTCKVAIGGDGGDELFGGYNHYRRMSKMFPYIRFTPKYISFVLKTLLPHVPTGTKGKNYLALIYSLCSNQQPVVNPIFYKHDFKFMFKNAKRLVDVRERTWEVNGADIVQIMTRLDFKNYFCEDILVKVDRASMANSLELRAPFLDPKILDFAFSRVPTRLKANSKNQKILLKLLAEKILPKNLEINRKQGFSVPLDNWVLDKSFKEYFLDILLSENCIFDKKFIENLYAAQERGARNGERIFALCMITNWINRFHVEFQEA